MPRRLLLVSLVCLMAVLAATTGRPARADRIQSLQAKIADAQVEEARLQSDIGSIESRIRTLESQVGGVSTQLDALQHDLDLQIVRLHRIRELYRFQTQQLDFFSHEYNVSVRRLNARLIEMYETQEEPSTLDVLMSASSLGDFLEQVDYVRNIGSQDAVITTQVHGAKERWHAVREKTKVTKKKVETVTRTIAVRTAEVRAEKQRLLISEKGLATVRGRKKEKLASVQESKAEYLHEVAGLQAASRQVTAQLQSSGSSSYDSSPSSSGLI
jgi:peptidoglycan hydrolase CwlO-like protein